MPNHAHALLSGLNTGARVLEAAVRWKQLTGYGYRERFMPRGRAVNRTTRLWHRDIYDWVLRTETHALHAIRYIVSDPVRSGRAADLHTYRWFGSECWSRDDLIEIATTDVAPYWWPRPTV
jgi:hypothetical protein